MKSFLILSLVLFASFTHAAPTPDPEMTDDEKDMIENLIKPNIRVLEKDIRVYHYYGSNYTAQMDTSVDSQLFRNYFQRSLSVFWAQTGGGGNAGYGLYAAIDPVHTRGYGRSMLEITIKKGSKILPKFLKWKNLKPGEKNAALQAKFISLRSQLKAMGYSKASSMKSYKASEDSNEDEDTGVFMQQRSAGFRKALMDLGIVAFAYPYSSTMCRTNDSDSFGEGSQAYLIIGHPTNYQAAVAGRGIDSSAFEIRGYTSQKTTFSRVDLSNYNRIQKAYSHYGISPRLNPHISEPMRGRMGQVLSASEKKMWTSLLDNCVME